MPTENSTPSNQTSTTDSLRSRIEPLLTDLLYPSESDESVTFVTCYLKQAEPLTDVQIKDWQMLPPSVYVEEILEADFWEPVTTDQDWYNDDEKKRTATFQQLKQIMETELSVRQVFRVGETEMDLFLLGRQSTGERAGLQTKIVQT